MHNFIYFVCWVKKRHATIGCSTIKVEIVLSGMLCQYVMVAAMMSQTLHAFATTTKLGNTQEESNY